MLFSDTQTQKLILVVHLKASEENILKKFILKQPGPFENDRPGTPLLYSDQLSCPKSSWPCNLDLGLARPRVSARSGERKQQTIPRPRFTFAGPR